SFIVPIRAGNAEPPLFLLHGVGGKVLGFHTLVKHLEVDRPIYGVEYSVHPSTPAKLRLEDLAEDYIREIRTIQPQGPYHFLGYSFGGLLAYEIAQQLLSKREPVAMLGMIDTFLMSGATRSDTLSRVRHVLMSAGRLARRTFDRSRGMTYLRELVVRRIQDRIGRGRQRLYAMLANRGRPIPKYLERPHDVNWFAANRYRPRPYPGTITLFRASMADAAIDELYGYHLG